MTTARVTVARTAPTPVRLTPDQRAKADRLADELGVTRSEAVRRMIDAYPFPFVSQRDTVQS